MCDLATAAMFGGSLLKMENQLRQAEWAEKAAENEAAVLELERRRARDENDVLLDRHNRRSKEELSAGRASYGASGVMLGAGSPESSIEGGRNLAEGEKRNIINNAFFQDQNYLNRINHVRMRGRYQAGSARSKFFQSLLTEPMRWF